MSSKTTVTRPKSMRARLQPEVDLGFRWSLMNTVLLLAGIMALVAGYVSLAKGSLTLAPVLLVTAYCGLIPAALLARRDGAEPGE